MKNVLPNPWLLGLGITILCFVLIHGLKRLLVTRLSHLENEHNTKWGDIFIYMLRHTTSIFILGSSVYIALEYIPHN